MRKRKSEEKKRLSHRIHTRITREKYEELQALMRRSNGIRSLSELLRNLLDKRPVKLRSTGHPDSTLLNELAGIRKEIKAIGVNINQAARWLNSDQLPENKIAKALDIVLLYQQTDEKVSQLFSLIAKVSEQWSYE